MRIPFSVTQVKNINEVLDIFQIFAVTVYNPLIVAVSLQITLVDSWCNKHQLEDHSPLLFFPSNSLYLYDYYLNIDNHSLAFEVNVALGLESTV